MKHISFIAALAIVLGACQSGYDKDLSAIEQHEAELASIEVSGDTDKALHMVDLYNQFAERYPDDSLAPIFLMRSAEVLTNIGHTDEAIDIYDTILGLYPGFEDLGGCLFMKGYAYERDEQFDSARAVYTRFVEQYPDHVLADDTRKMLPNLGIPPEQLLEKLLAGASDNNLTQQ